MNDLWNSLASQLANRIGQLVESRLSAFVDKYCRSSVKIIYSEQEAADFLGKVSVDTLQAWRKRGLISHARYPVGRLAEGEEDRLGGIYTYSLADLLDFRDRYHIGTPGSSRYSIRPVLSMAGAEIEEGRLKRVA